MKSTTNKNNQNALDEKLVFTEFSISLLLFLSFFTYTFVLYFIILIKIATPPKGIYEP